MREPGESAGPVIGNVQCESPEAGRDLCDHRVQRPAFGVGNRAAPLRRIVSVDSRNHRQSAITWINEFLGAIPLQERVIEDMLAPRLCNRD